MPFADLELTNKKHDIRDTRVPRTSDTESSYCRREADVAKSNSPDSSNTLADILRLCVSDVSSECFKAIST